MERLLCLVAPPLPPAAARSFLTPGHHMGPADPCFQVKAATSMAAYNMFAGRIFLGFLPKTGSDWSQTARKVMAKFSINIGKNLQPAESAV